ncbi:MAG: 30S ribosomal protein S2 [Proteobacteria bacterium]|nr:30S ribosomal protein S2 [Pseudomonadota bacterium]
MSLPSFTLRQLLEAGVHFGHYPRRWNPKMAPYIFGVRNGVHIIHLEKTVVLLHKALTTIRDIVSQGGRVLFVGTKPQASTIVAESAQKCGQYYVNHRWLGGMLTNWKTISHSIKRLKDLDKLLEEKADLTLTKKELLKIEHERDKLSLTLGGIREMGGRPDLLIVLDVNKDHIAIQEAQRLNIPIIGILDSNSNPDGVTLPVPGNDDATRSIALYCDLFANAVLSGLQAEMIAAGIDVGAAISAPDEPALQEEVSVSSDESPQETAREAS